MPSASLPQDEPRILLVATVEWAMVLDADAPPRRWAEHRVGTGGELGRVRPQRGDGPDDPAEARAAKTLLAEWMQDSELRRLNKTCRVLYGAHVAALRQELVAAARD